MTDRDKTRDELIQELDLLRRRVAELEQSERAVKLSEKALRQSRESFERLAEEMAIIAKIGRVVGSTLDISQVYKRVAIEVRRLIPYDRFLVNLKRPHGQFLTAYVSGIDNPRRRVGDLYPLRGATSGIVMNSRTGILIQPADAEEIKGLYPNLYETFKTGLRSTLSVPLISMDEVIGSMSFRSKKLKAYTQRDLLLAEGIGMQVAGAIANAQLFENFKKAEEAIQASLKEKELLLREVHHRVKNNMGVISGLLALKASSSENPEVIQNLQESNHQIQSMALIHEKLYGEKDWTSIDLGSYVTEMVGHLSDFYKGALGQITRKVEAHDVRLSIDKAIPFGLILNELVSNAFKHAFPGALPGEIEIIVRKTGGGDIELIVRDNGVGLPRGFDPHKTGSVGLYLVNGLVKNQLHGELSVHLAEGTEFRVRFPL